MRTILALLLTTVALTAADAPLRIKLSAGAVFAGRGELRVRCSVAKNPDNRKLRIGIENEQTSIRDLTTDNWVTHDLWVENISCEAGLAFCEIEDNLERRNKQVQQFLVLGCPNRPSAFPEE